MNVEDVFRSREMDHVTTRPKNRDWLAINSNLVGGLVAIFGIFPYIGNFIIPIDFHIFQRGSNHQPGNLCS